MGASRWALAAMGMLPALALACVLVGNWAAGGAPVEALQSFGFPAAQLRFQVPHLLLSPAGFGEMEGL